MSTGSRNFWLDAVLLVAFGIAIVSGLMMWMIDAIGPTTSLLRVGLVIWRHIHPLSVALIGVGVILHLLWHWKWIKVAFRPEVKPRQVKINRLFDGLLLIAFGLVMLSGLGGHAESQAAGAVPVRIDSARVDPLHTLAGVSMLALVLVHQVLHWKWIVTTTRRILGIKI